MPFIKIQPSPDSGRFLTPPPLSLYVHIPWCIQKCPYCDFNSHASSTIPLQESEYVEALLSDLESELPFIWGRSVTSIFIGGGTPSLFSAASIDRLLSGIRARVKLQPDAEVTLEANPGTFEQQKFRDFKAAGINRLSIGVQSFHNPHLAILGRIHNSKEALTAIELAVNTFNKVNVDLMYALPDQSILEAITDVDTAIKLGVKHISAYHLTLEPNTAFGHAPPSGIPDDDLATEIEEAVHETLHTSDFTHYETSAFCKDRQYAQHNLNYWQFGDYIGIGAGAHGKISDSEKIVRTTRPKHPLDYLRQIHVTKGTFPIGTRQTVSKQDLPFEFMMNALRLHQGVPNAYFIERTGLSLQSLLPTLDIARKQGLLTQNPTRLVPTELGQRFLNNLLTLFLQEKDT